MVIVFVWASPADVQENQLTCILDCWLLLVPQKHQVIMDEDEAYKSAVEGLSFGFLQKQLGFIREWCL